VFVGAFVVAKRMNGIRIDDRPARERRNK